MLNVHIYPSDFKNESRIERTAAAIEALNLFSKIDLVGLTRTQEKNVLLSSVVSIKCMPFGLGRTTAFSSKFFKLINLMLWQLHILLYYRAKKVGCINVHSLTVLPLGVLLKFFTGAQLVYDTHELESQTTGASWFRKKVGKAIEASLIKFADQTIFVSNSILQWYVEQYSITNGHVILNCPAMLLEEQSDLFRNCFSISSDKKIFLYQGVIAEGRGIRLLADVFAKRIESAVLVIMGYGPLVPYVKTIAAQNENVFFHEAVSPSELLRYTSSADFGLSIILPKSLSYEYCMPNKIFEYLHADLPVIVSPTIEQKNFVESQGIGFVLKDYSNDALEDVVRDACCREPAYFASNITEAKTKFSWAVEEKNLQSIYKKMFERT